MPEDRLNERDVEELLRGRQPADHTELADVATWMSRLREESRAQSPPPMNPRLRMQIEQAPVSAAQSRILDDDRAVVDSPRWAGSGGAFARRRWQVAGIAAVALMVVGVMVGVGLGNGSQPDDLDVRTPPAPEQTGSGLPADGVEDDVATDGSVKQPPPPAEPTTTAPPTTEALPSTAPESDGDDRGRDGAPGQDRRRGGGGEDADTQPNWQDGMCQWLEDHDWSDRPGGPGDYWEEVCDVDGQ